MSDKKYWHEQSRLYWYDNNGNTSNDGLKIGCLQRIADATEAMSQNYSALIAERDRYKRWYENEQAEKTRLARSNAALRGIINRMKKERKKRCK